MVLQSLLYSNLNKKLFLTKNALVNLSALMSSTTSEDGRETDRITYENMSKVYHKMNDFGTLGRHRYWRRTTINNIPITENSQILDSAGGTGLNTMRLLEKTKNFPADSNFCVTVYDINPAMMKVGREKSEMLGYNQKFVRWIEGDIQKLPFEDGSFDTYLMFFGIRQNINFDQVFKEANRVLKSNGKIVIGDFCYSKDPAISQWLFIKFLRYVGNNLNYLFCNNNEGALFLLQSIINLPSPNETLTMLQNAGFKQLQFKPLTAKIAGMYTGYKM